MADLDNSFDENDSIDLASVVAEFPNGDDHPDEDIKIKQLANAFDMVNTNMKVYLRVRPFKGKEEGTIKIESETSILTVAPEQSKRAVYTKMESRNYVFTRVFGEDSKQEDLFEHTTAPLLKKFLNGENCVLFAYGMTNAGKTYTVQGANNNPGILPRLVTAVLDEMNSNSSQSGWDLHVSMLEIYQENIYDLLSKKRKEKLSIRDANGKVEVNKLSTHSIACTKDACKLMDTAAYNRSKSSTFLNTGSSRSHAVYTITLDRGIENGVVTQSVAFQLVDLAGAERGNRTKATGAQQKEANNINMSLMQLWRCLQGMKKRNTELGSSQEIIPFRESKLTHLLMPILNRAGMSGTAMIACVNPQSDDYDETLSILGNASIASRIKEISDVGRTASQHQSNAVSAALIAAAKEAKEARELAKEASREAAAIAAKEAKDAAKEAVREAREAAAAAGKRRRVESGNSTGSSGVVAPQALRRSRESVCTGLPGVVTNANPGAGGKRAPNTRSVALSGAKRKVDSEGSMDSLATAATSGGMEQEGEESELKRLRREVFQLREDKAQMEFYQLNRETEIREEVSQEMAKYTSQLLQQNRTLQSQLSDLQSSSTSSDLTRSVKKARKQQMSRIAEEFSDRDVQEVEDELERAKATYEQEIAMLKAQNNALASAVQKLQTTAASSVGGPAGIMPPSGSLSNAIANKFSSVFNHQPMEVAVEYSKRFSKKNDENSVNVHVEKKSPLGKSPLSISPNRSPLSEVRNAGNSPVALKNYQNGTISAAAKRVDSPQRIRDENSATASNHSTRLRSQLRA